MATTDEERRELEKEIAGETETDDILDAVESGEGIDDEDELESQPAIEDKLEEIDEKIDRLSKGKLVKRRVSEEEQARKEVRDIVDSLDPGARTEMKLTIERLEPMKHRGKSAAGHIATITGNEISEVDRDYIKSNYGGTKYDIILMGPKKKKDGEWGGNKIYYRRKWKITGDPILEGTPMDGNPGTSPDMLKQTMNLTDNLVRTFSDDKKEYKEKSEELQKTLLEMMKDGGGKGMELMIPVFGLFQQMMTTQQKNLELQIEKEREERKAEERHREEERREHREEMKIMKEESEKKAESGLAPMIKMMELQMKTAELNAKENESRSDKMMAQTLAMFTGQSEMSRANAENQSKMMQSTYDTNMQIMMKNLDRLNAEAAANKTDIMSEVKKLKMLKDLGIFGGDEKGDWKDKIFDNIETVGEAIPDIINAFGGLLRGQPVQQQQARVQAPPRHPALPTARPAGRPMTAKPEQPAEKPSEGVVKKRMQLALAVNALKKAAEDAVEGDVTPEDFVSQSIMGQFEDNDIRMIAERSTAEVTDLLQSNLQREDSPLLTTLGRDFLRKVHAVLRKRFLGEE